MTKTQEELKTLKTECETVTNNLQELSEQELTNIDAGINDFQEPEELDLASEEHKELRRERKKEDISNKLKEIFLYSDSKKEI